MRKLIVFVDRFRSTYVHFTSMEETTIDDILKDVDDLSQSPESVISGSQQDEEEGTEPETNCRSAMVDLDVIEQACEKLIADDCMPAQVHDICQSVDRPKLIPCLQFLVTCLTVAGAYFKSSIKEKAWAKFHAAVADQNNMRPLDEIVTPKVSTWLCFTTFEIMFKNVCNNDTTTDTFDNNSESDIDLTGRDRYIIIYIGGAVVTKIKQKAYRLKNIELKQEILGLVEALLAANGESGSSMTSLLDRGGLVKLHPNIELLFVNLETTFRALFIGFSSTALPFKAYFQKCLSLDAVSTRFHEHLYPVNAQETTKEKLFRDVTFLYFKIRAHHKCKTFMDNFHRKTQMEKREKGLRKRLKQKK